MVPLSTRRLTEWRLSQISSAIPVVTEHHKREEGSVQAKNLRPQPLRKSRATSNKKSVLRRIAETMKIDLQRVIS